MKQKSLNQLDYEKLMMEIDSIYEIQKYVEKYVKEYNSPTHFYTSTPCPRQYFYPIPFKKKKKLRFYSPLIQKKDTSRVKP